MKWKRFSQQDINCHCITLFLESTDHPCLSSPTITGLPSKVDHTLGYSVHRNHQYVLVVTSRASRVATQPVEPSYKQVKPVLSVGMTSFAVRAYQARPNWRSTQYTQIHTHHGNAIQSYCYETTRIHVAESIWFSLCCTYYDNILNKGKWWRSAIRNWVQAFLHVRALVVIGGILTTTLWQPTSAVHTSCK